MKKRDNVEFGVFIEEIIILPMKLREVYLMSITYCSENLKEKAEPETTFEVFLPLPVYVNTIPSIHKVAAFIYSISSVRPLQGVEIGGF